MLRRLRMGFEAGTSEMLNKYRTRLHVSASEYAHVMTSAMWNSIARIRSVHHPNEGIPAAREGFRKRGKCDNVKEQIARFQLIRKAMAPHGGKKVCFQNLSAKGCSGATNACSKAEFCHFVPKKSDIPADALMALETEFGALRPELKLGQGDTYHGVESRPSRRASQQNVGDGPGLATNSVVLCNLRHNKTTCANSEGSKLMKSSLNNAVSNLHSQGVTQASRERERPASHAESTHPQGVAKAYLQRERSQSHVESSHPQGVVTTSLHGERSVTHGEYTSTRCGDNIPGKVEITVTRGEFTSTKCGADIPRTGEITVTHGEYTSTMCGDDIPGKGKITITREEFTFTRCGTDIPG
jgi:hypothetical protein